MSYLLRSFRDGFRSFIGPNNNEKVVMSSGDNELHTHLSDALFAGKEDVRLLYNLIAIQNPSLPVLIMNEFKEDVEDSDIKDAYFDALLHLEENDIIVFDKAHLHFQNNARGKTFGLFFRLTNPRYGDILKKTMPKQLYYDVLFEALEYIDGYINYWKYLIRYDKPIGNSEWMEILLARIAIPQAIHVWKQALNYDDLITQFWHVPIGIMDYMTTVKKFKNDDSYATVQQLAKETSPHFHRLFPDPAPLARRLFQLVFTDISEDIFESMTGNRQHFVERKKLLDFYLDYKKPEIN